MRQGYDIEIVAEFAHVRHMTDQCCQNGQLIQELANREFADRDHEAWFQDPDLSSKPGTAERDLFPGGNAIAPLRVFAWEATANRCHINRLAKFHLGNTGFLFEPFEHGFTRSPGERSS